jgi:hypothetical protein
VNVYGENGRTDENVKVVWGHKDVLKTSRDLLSCTRQVKSLESEPRCLILCVPAEFTAPSISNIRRSI